MSAPRRNRPARMRGVALLLVLWLVLLLAGIVAAFALSARVESTSVNGLARGVRAAQAARAGIELAVARMSDPEPQRRWTPDGSPHAFTLGDAEVEVAVRDENAKIDLNGAPLDLLARLFEQLGEPRDAANRLAGAIVDWRDPDSLTQPGGGAEDADYAAAGLEGGAKDAPFETVAEVEQVLGMRPDLYARAAPHLTVHSGNARPDARFADPVVRAALGLPPAETAAGGPLPVGGSGTYSIDSRARLTDGRSAHLSVVVRVGGNALPGSTYTPLRWQDEALSP